MDNDNTHAALVFEVLFQFLYWTLAKAHKEKQVTSGQMEGEVTKETDSNNMTTAKVK